MNVYFMLFEIRKAETDTKSALTSRWHPYSVVLKQRPLV